MLSEAIRTWLKEFKALILDADGVWFDGKETRLVIVSTGEVGIIKTRDFRDGQGLSFLRALGIKIVFASGEGHPLASIVDKINEAPSVQSGAWAKVEYFTGQLKSGSKVASIETWLQKHGLKWEDCAYIGDDRTDVEAMRLAGLKVCPHDAQRPILKIADIQLTKNGGAGAVREFAELVLDARGIDEATLPTA